jgi:hypothetical protein
LYEFLISPIRVTFPTHFILLDLIALLMKINFNVPLKETGNRLATNCCGKWFARHTRGVQQASTVTFDRELHTTGGNPTSRLIGLLFNSLPPDVEVKW